MGSMGADAADLDNDLRPDLVVTEMLPQSLARKKTKATYESWDKYQLVNKACTRFREWYSAHQKRFEVSRTSEPPTEWALPIVDMDNDGLKDIFISNGFTKIYSIDYLALWPMKPTYVPWYSRVYVITKLIDAMPSQAVPNQACKKVILAFLLPMPLGALRNLPSAMEVPMAI